MSKKLTWTNSTQVRKNRGYSKILNTMWSLVLLSIIVISGCKKNDFKGEVVGVCPTVISDPVDQVVDVPLGKVITITFNTPMNPTTINNSTFFIKQGVNLIGGTIAPTSNSAVFTFTPTLPLQPFTTYTGTVTTGATDTLRSAMVSNYVWTFKTIPQITLSSNPVAGGITSGAGTFAQGTVTTVTATPNPGYVFSSWSGDATGSTNPLSVTVNGNKNIIANFTQIVTYSVTLSSNPVIGGSTTGGGSYVSGSSVTITAVPNSGYTFTSWSGDASGSTNPLTFVLNSNKIITANFTAGGPIIGPGTGPANVSLGGAGNFSVLAQSGISTTGITLVNGNIGVSPAAATTITGFGLIMDSNGQSSTSPLVTGKIYAADYAAPTPANLTTAINDMHTAYTTLNGLVTPAPVVGAGAGNITGLNLAPGLYKWSTGVLITSPGVTLSGGANDTWVFQIAQDLTVNPGAFITLSGGAQAKNITWVVAGQATLGTNVNFSGNILSKTLISVNTGSKVTGKLMAQTAVTLNADIIVQP